MTARTRLAALVVATLTLLAFATTADQRGLTVVPAATAEPVSVAQVPDAGEGVGPALWWCAYARPHAADEVVFAAWVDLGPWAASASCVSTHPGAEHWYRVSVWDYAPHDGVLERVTWTPLGPWWT